MLIIFYHFPLEHAAMFGIHINLSRCKLVQMLVYFGISTLNHQWNYELHSVCVCVCAHVFLRHDKKETKSKFVSQFVHFSIGRWIGLWSSHRLCLINWMKRSKCIKVYWSIKCGWCCFTLNWIHEHTHTYTFAAEKTTTHKTLRKMDSWKFFLVI